MTSDDEGAKGQEFVVAHRFMWRETTACRA